jgi:hypothetical protein
MGTLLPPPECQQLRCLLSTILELRHKIHHTEVNIPVKS